MLSVLDFRVKSRRVLRAGEAEAPPFALVVTEVMPLHQSDKVESVLGDFSARGGLRRAFAIEIVERRAKISSDDADVDRQARRVRGEASDVAFAEQGAFGDVRIMLGFCGLVAGRGPRDEGSYSALRPVAFPNDGLQLALFGVAFGGRKRVSGFRFESAVGFGVAGDPGAGEVGEVVRSDVTDVLGNAGGDVDETKEPGRRICRNGPGGERDRDERGDSRARPRRNGLCACRASWEIWHRAWFFE